MSTLIAFSQGSQDSTRSSNPVENLKAYVYKVKGVEYVMFQPEDYRKLLSLGREYAILLEIQDSVVVKHAKLQKQVIGYITQVNNLQQLSDSLGLEIIDLKKDFDEYSESTEKQIAKLLRKNTRLSKGVFILSAIAVVQTIMMIVLAK